MGHLMEVIVTGQLGFLRAIRHVTRRQNLYLIIKM